MIQVRLSSRAVIDCGPTNSTSVLVHVTKRQCICIPSVSLLLSSWSFLCGLWAWLPSRLHAGFFMTKNILQYLNDMILSNSKHWPRRALFKEPGRSIHLAGWVTTIISQRNLRKHRFRDCRYKNDLTRDKRNSSKNEC